MSADSKSIEVSAPDGYKFIVVNEDVEGCPITEMTLNVSDLQKSIGKTQS